MPAYFEVSASNSLSTTKRPDDEAVARLFSKCAGTSDHPCQANRFSLLSQNRPLVSTRRSDVRPIEASQTVFRTYPTGPPSRCTLSAYRACICCSPKRAVVMYKYIAKPMYAPYLLMTSYVSRLLMT